MAERTTQTEYEYDGRTRGSFSSNASSAGCYTFGSYIDEPLVMVKANGDRYWYSTNDLYSVYALTDSTGTVVERYMFDPYGKVTVLDGLGTTVRAESAYGNPWTFTGRRLDGETGLMYYRTRYLDNGLGRFLNRNPWQRLALTHPLVILPNFSDDLPPPVGLALGRGTGSYIQDRYSLYDYCRANPTQSREPLSIVVGPPAGLEKEHELFMQWYKAEKAAGLGWLKGLWACPCVVKIVCSECTNPNSKIWTDPTEWLWGYHKGAKCCMRSRAANRRGAGQQCCYDKSGKLITHGEGAGTPDKIQPTVAAAITRGGHHAADVAPWDLAAELGDHWKNLYLKVRPPNNALKCPENPPRVRAGAQPPGGAQM